MFDGEGRFNLADFEYKVKKLTRNQEYLVIILNTPANNPTGYALTMDDWYGVKKVLDEVPLEKKITLVLDVAYIDFAGDPEEVRSFYRIVDNLRANILPIIAYSASKTFTFYGARCAAMICLAHSPEVAEEFVKVNSFSARATWSNSPRAPQEVIEQIYADEELLAEVEAERTQARDMLLARGRAFEEEAAKCGLEIVPFSAGFFVTVPCDDPDGLCQMLNKRNVFLIPFDNGVRVSIASSSEAKCRRLPAIIKEAMAEMTASAE
jgi:aspartate/tyrosine/aromatic aminotransferase